MMFFSRRRIVQSALAAICVTALSLNFSSVAFSESADSPLPEMTKGLIPRPKRVNFLPGAFQGKLPLVFNSLHEQGLQDASLRRALGEVISLADQPAAAIPETGLRLVVGDPKLESDSPEGYRLRVDRQQITVTGRTVSAVLMGIRTLAQLAVDGSLPQVEIADWPDMKLRAAHLCYCSAREDTPYNVPNFDALLEQIDRLAAMKYNAVLLELTAFFPYQKNPAVACKLAFTPEQIAQLRRRLQVQQMEIIPLVQCLGHVYEVLRNDAYREYRELPTHTQQYCPTNPKTIDLFLEFVDEYRVAFPEIKRFHIGGDESRMLGRCERCRKKVAELGISRLYVDHVGEAARQVQKRGLTPLLWADILENHPEAIPLLPKSLALVYWNYDLPQWPRPYAAHKFLEQGFEVIAATGVQFGSSGTNLSVYYPEALRGIETLTSRFHRDGGREMITTNWRKSSPFENTDYGMAYAADLAWNVAGTRADFQKRYAQWTFGLDDPAVCGVYETLSLFLPYAEAVEKHRAKGKLDLLDLSGFSFTEKWKLYADPKNEPAVLKQLDDGRTAAREAAAALDRYLPLAKRGKRQLELLSMSAECIEAKAQFALALHAGRKLENETAAKPEALSRWCADLPAILRAWDLAKEKHARLLAPSGFAPVVKLANDMLFEPAEREFIVAMSDRLTARIPPTKSMASRRK